ncbi:MAG: hypothetical protein R3B70_28230 [Polyangiaceae bacterium]
MTPKVDYERLVPVNEMAGEDDEETAQLHEMLEEARRYLKGQRWCRSIERELLGLGVGGVVAVFLVDLVRDPGVHDLLWVVCGDLPTAYLVTDAAPTATVALEVYCELMDEWIDAVRNEAPLNAVFPVGAQPTEDNVARLERRISFLRGELIPAFEREGTDT